MSVEGALASQPMQGDSLLKISSTLTVPFGSMEYSQYIISNVDGFYFHIWW